MIFLDFLLIFSVFIFLFVFFKKSQILIDDTTFSSHKIFGKENNSPILLGGIYFLIIILLCFGTLFFDISYVL